MSFLVEILLDIILQYPQFGVHGQEIHQTSLIDGYHTTFLGLRVIVQSTEGRKKLTQYLIGRLVVFIL